MAIPESVKKYLILAGCTMLLMPVSIDVAYGNILPYILSYYQSDVSTHRAYVHPLWVITAVTVAIPLGFALAEFLTRTLQKRIAMVLGVLLTSLSIIFSFYAIAQPLIFILVFGVVQGTGGGFVTSLTFQILTEWMPENKELAFGVTAAGPNFYALIYMFLGLYLINPDNKPPDITVDKTNYFTDPHILDSVPYFFLKTGLLTLAIQIVGLALIQFQHRSTETTYETTYAGIQLEVMPLANSEEINKLASPEDGASAQRGYGSHAVRDHTRQETELQSQKKQQAMEDKTDGSHISSNLTNKKLPEPDDKNQPEGITSLLDQSPFDTAESYSNMPPTEVLGSRLFWVTWLVFVFMGHTAFTHMNLYKQYGLTKIYRDKLLVYSGVVGVTLIIAGRHFTMMLARKFGTKPTLIVMCGLSNLFMTLMPVTLQYYSPLYILLVMLEFYTISSVFVFMNVLPLLLFGSRYYANNLALLRTSQIVIYLVSSIITPPLIEYAGWGYVYMCTTMTSALGLLICLLLPAM